MTLIDSDPHVDSSNLRVTAARRIAYEFFDKHFNGERPRGGEPVQLARFDILDHPTLDDEMLQLFQAKPPEQLPPAVYLSEIPLGAEAHLVVQWPNADGIQGLIDRVAVRDEEGRTTVTYTARSMTPLEMAEGLGSAGDPEESDYIAEMINRMSPEQRDAIAGSIGVAAYVELDETVHALD